MFILFIFNLFIIYVSDISFFYVIFGFHLLIYIFKFYQLFDLFVYFNFIFLNYFYY